MRILLTGGLGFIGSAVVRQAIEAGHEVLNIDLETYASDSRTVASASESNRYQHRRIDICDEAAVRAALNDFNPDRVMHLAAESHVDRSIDGPAAFVRTNVVGTTVMLQEAQAWLADNPSSDFRFVHISTDEVFGSLEPDDEPFTEISPYDPRSPYSASKAASDHFARAWFHTYGLPVVVTNCSNNYGPYQFPEKLIPLMVIKALRREPLPVYGTGDNVRDWIHVEDHAAGLLQAAIEGVPGSTYLFGGDAERTNLGVVHAICDLVDQIEGSSADSRRDLITFVTDRPGHDHRYAIDYSATTSSLGWTPSRTFGTGIADTVTWYLENTDYWEPILADRYAGTRLGTA
ncbi:MAG: dTDP-glucose 4,6-dehydratase [Acidimicrobiia bacterium]|nr:dTDP-glucose 4,6-dehydratase [Acidimicrobiia bacterium]